MLSCGFPYYITVLIYHAALNALSRRILWCHRAKDKGICKKAHVFWLSIKQTPLGCGNFLLFLSCLAVSKMASSIRLHHCCLLSPSSALPSPQQTWSSLDPSESHPCWSNGRERALSSEHRFAYSFFSCYTRNTVLRVPNLQWVTINDYVIEVFHYKLVKVRVWVIHLSAEQDLN